MILDEIMAAVANRLIEDKQKMPLAALEEEAGGVSRPSSFESALARPGLGIIAEIKKASPSAGDIMLDADVSQIASDYSDAGAAAISVLTERDFFKGSREDLSLAAEATSCPLLRKDFIIDHYQILEAFVLGASAYLLIVALHSRATLSSLIHFGRELGLDCLVEVHDRDELETAIRAGARIIGINNRNLKTFEVDLNTSLNLKAEIPRDCLTVSESGILNRDDLHRMATAGFDAALVGEGLMRDKGLNILSHQLENRP